ncbi:MAG: 4-(cytidine 5'-diphospho)-2-C-methyl-D-erythritol kinase [Planctomycetes bacterium]|nr:4-(cytidine 5'-diphospho)-2-C-methyl-D-erythritol kinase [Planctomycetota bacterium]
MSGPLATVGEVLALRCPAKLNLYLHVLGRRPDGYHELDTVFCALELSDLLIAARRGEPGIALRIVEGAGGGLPVAAGPDNLVHRAALAVLRAAGLDGRTGLAFHLHKRIPAGGGLGGGSSDAAAALRLANRLCGAPLAAAELDELAVGLGADVPFFLRGGTCRGRGIGERLEPLVDAPPLAFLLVLPPFGTDTGAVFRELAAQRNVGGAQPRSGISYRLDPRQHLAFFEVSRNDLEPPAMRRHPELAALFETLCDPAVAAGLRMSGSGSTLFAARATDAEIEAMVGRVRDRLAAQGTPADGPGAVRLLATRSAPGLAEPVVCAAGERPEWFGTDASERAGPEAG